MSARLHQPRESAKKKNQGGPQSNGMWPIVSPTMVLINSWEGKHPLIYALVVIKTASQAGSKLKP